MAYSIYNQIQKRYYIIFIDDGSTVDSWDIIQDLDKIHNQVKGIKFRKNYGKAQALN
ncbi:glycosyltransferase, partial [Ornithobacterium rhinotracheale]